MRNLSLLRNRRTDNLTASNQYFFFSSTFRKLRADALTQVHIDRNSDPASVLSAANAALRSKVRDGSFAAIIGAIPFSSKSLPSIFVSDSIDTNISNSTALPGAARTSARRIKSAPDEHAYAESVRRGLGLIAEGALEKIVLARTLEIDVNEPIDLDLLLATMVHRNARGYTFSVPLALGGEAAVFTGASPELLIRKSGSQIETNPLAGSIRRGATPEEDKANAEALLASSKDRREHQIVVAAVDRVLRPYCRRIDVPDAPSLIKTPTVWHLSTHIAGELADPGTSSLELALALHPTPAVCGHPTDAAFAAIAEIEGYDRGLYAGLVGWSDAKGDGEWAVALRCAEISGNQVRLFAGAGIVAGSDPLAELEETGAKLKTMLDALWIEQPLIEAGGVSVSAGQEGGRS